MIQQTLLVEDCSRLIPLNPNYTYIPKRVYAITQIVWHCSKVVPYSLFQLLQDSRAPNCYAPKGCPTPNYCYYITQDLIIYQLIAENTRTWHVGVPKKYSDICPNWNEFCLGICFEHTGKKSDILNASQFELGLLLSAEICKRRSLPANCVVGHRELPGTGYIPSDRTKIRDNCPGSNIDLHYVRNRVQLLLTDIASRQISIVRQNVLPSISWQFSPQIG